MTVPRFLQIHTLHSYTAALLNRDDLGIAKRLPYGDVMRTRISSQCLKRHWRMADKDPHALHRIEGAEQSLRSRELVTKMIIKPLVGKYSDDLIEMLDQEFQKAVYGDKADKGKLSRPTLLFGAPELKWLAREAERLAEGAGTPAQLRAAVRAWARSFKDNIKTLRESSALPAGLTAALFGRMVTSDPAANIEAPLHVAHAFTVHAEEAESDYLVAVDDLKRSEDDWRADTIQETELTSGLFYGYVVVDLPGLISNCGRDRALAGEIVHNLVHLIAEVSPGAKRGSTAPYGRAGLLLAEAGDRQPRSLAEAFRKPARPDLDDAVFRLAAQLRRFDQAYATGEQRCCVNLSDVELEGIVKAPLQVVAQWAAGRVAEAPDA